MKQNLLLIFLIPFISISQIQINDDIDGDFEGDQSGYSVSLSSNGNIIAVGSPYSDGNGNASGHVRIYENVSGVWTQIGNDLHGESVDDQLGFSVSLSSDGSIIAIGARNNNSNGNDSGQVRIYENISGVWTQIGNDINGEVVDDQSGFRVSLSSNGSIVAISAPFNDGNGVLSGHARIYTYDELSSTWMQIGDDIDGEAAYDKSGFSMSLSSDGSIIAIGAPLNDVNGANSGHVRIYENISNVWTQIGEDIDGEFAGALTGFSVSLSANGSMVAIGAPANPEHSIVAVGTPDNADNGNNFGVVRVYEIISGVWTPISYINHEVTGDQLGYSVSLSADGSMVAIGAIGNDGNGEDSGHVRVYENESNIWTQIGSDIDGEAVNDRSGNSVSLSADGYMVAIGAISNDANGNNSGHVRVYNLSTVLSSNSFVLSQFDIFPNSSKNQIVIKLNKGLILEKVFVYNSLGQFIQFSSKKIIDTSRLSKGLYYVEVKTNKGKATKKFIIK